MEYETYIVIDDLELSRHLTRHEAIVFNSNILKYSTFQDFRAFYEIKFNDKYKDFSEYNGESICPSDYYPTNNCWFYDCIENEIYHEDSEDMFPLSTLDFMIRYVLQPFGVNVSGQVDFYCEEKREGCSYVIRDNVIKYHVNESLQLIEDMG